MNVLKTMIHNKKLELEGIIEVTYPLPATVVEMLSKEDWRSIDQYFLKAEATGGPLNEFLKEVLDFDSIEHIIAIRSAPDDEDGIWHDDGSRILGFSLSLTTDHLSVAGGELRFRKKGESSGVSLTTRPMGQMLIFKTGIYGFEHMVSAVTTGKRIVIAGWCS